VTETLDELDVPELDPDGLLRYRGRWVATSRQEELALRPLLTRWRRTVTPRSLAEAAWAHEVPPPALSSLVRRLRRRVEPLGLTIHTIRARGFILEPASNPKGSTWLIS
jgi:two-component system, OmpR family, response regulator